MKTSPVLN